MLERVVFYNHYHNGDLFHSKVFVDYLMEQIKNCLGPDRVTFHYTHRMHPDVLKDMVLEYDPHIIQRLSDKGQVAVVHNTLFVNTWVGAYFGMGFPHDFECNIHFNMAMWEHICKYVQKLLNAEIHWNKNPLYKIPYVNRNFCKTDGIDAHMYKFGPKVPKVLICNGPVHSGQCPYNGDMDATIRVIASNFPDHNFYYTHKLGKELPSNCFYTGDIIQQPGCDLNEIAILSDHCGLIVGRFSGPFCFTATSKNLLLPTQSIKHYYAFGVDEKLWWPYQLEPMKARFHFRHWSSLTTQIELINDLEEFLKNQRIV
jgi:hypothetical protein